MKAYLVYIRTHEQTIYSEVIINDHSYIAIDGDDNLKEVIFNEKFEQDRFKVESSPYYNVQIGLLTEDPEDFDFNIISRHSFFDITKLVQPRSSSGNYYLLELPKSMHHLIRVITPNTLLHFERR